MSLVTNAHDAELFAADYLRRHGYPDAQATPVGTDSGIDVYSPHMICQVKNLNRPAGRPMIQNLAGSRHDGRHLVFFSKSGYSRQAIAEAKLWSMTLYQYDRYGNVRQVNDVRLPTPSGRSWYSSDWTRLGRFVLRLIDSKPTKHRKRR
jgi:hypothetical protein